MIRIILGALCIVLGLFVCVMSVVGLFRFRYVLNRMHAAALADTMGLFLCLLGTALLTGLTPLTCKLALAWIFMWIASPVASHLVARVELLLVGRLPDGTDQERGLEL